MSNLFQDLMRRSPILTITGSLHLLLFLLAVVLSLFDQRLVTGVNAWIKPMKFMISIAIYLWTLAWFVGYLSGPRWALRLLGWGASTAMILETGCLWIQAGRGVPSHFNTTTPFDATIFGAMGLLILFNSLLGLLLLTLFFQQRIEVSRVYLWGIRLGLVIFLFGSLQGMTMIANNGHAVGVPDGGRGLPFLNWSLEGGDLRIAHMLGLHALQVIPFFSYVISILGIGDRQESVSIGIVWAFSFLYLVLMGLAFYQAASGNPLVMTAGAANL
jgi:hypothetical protein